MSPEPEGAPLQFVWERQYHDRVKPAMGSPSRPPGEASRRRAIEGSIWTGWACREPEEFCQARVARRLNMIFSAAMQSFQVQLEVVTVQPERGQPASPRPRRPDGIQSRFNLRRR